MALNDYVVNHTANDPPLAAPTTSETIDAPDDSTYLMVVNGVTSTTVTVVQPGNDAIGEPKPDKVVVFASDTRLIKVDRRYKDVGTGKATVTITPITTVTACILRMQ